MPQEAFALSGNTRDGRRTVCRACDPGGGARRHVDLGAWEAASLYACVYCGAPYEHADHVIPRASGGPDTAHNLVPACAPCNLSKSDRPVLDWLVSSDSPLRA